MTQVFTDAQIQEILSLMKQHFSVAQYIGARYVPIFGRKGEESIEWDNSAPYEPLTIVLNQGNSFTSRQYVPTGVDINNTEFWAETGNYNAQVEQYRQEVLNFENSIIKKAFTFETVEEMSNYTELFNGAICHTNGFHESNDGGAAWYVISNTLPEGTTEANNKDVIECGALYANMILNNECVTPEMLGAYGDGSNNDGPIIQYAINKYKTVKLLKHQYKTTSTINLPSDSVLRGEDRRLSVIIVEGNVDAIKLHSNDSSVSNTSIYICNLTIKNTNSGGIGISQDAESSNIVVENVLITGFNKGVCLDSIWVSRFVSVQCYNCTIGFEVEDNDTISTSLTFMSCYVNNCEYGYKLYKLTYSSLVSCACDHSSIAAYYINTSRITLVSCACELFNTAVFIDGYGSVVELINFTGSSGSNPEGLIITNQTTQPLYRTTRLSIDGIRLFFNTDVYNTPSKAADIEGFIRASGNAKITIDNYIFIDVQGITPPQISGTNNRFIKIPQISNAMTAAEFPQKGMILNGDILINNQTSSSTSIGWLITRSGGCYKEAYDASHTYAIGDQVSSGSAIYVCIQAHTGSGTSNITDTNYWKIYGVNYNGTTKSTAMFRELTF